ncbi:helicase associated domain-containing protein [Kitasatospora sp. NPDC056138]|uniref:helicase associated domain-containing protein n=1 Tax=Kitasatospora sp. NPDC056138 TaxID=3345724 RepID=UPI0035D7465A
MLNAARGSELDALGTIWSKNANAVERGYADAAAFHGVHSHLALPAAKPDDYAVGAWMRRPRKAEKLTKDQIVMLTALDELGLLTGLEPLLPPDARLPRGRRHGCRCSSPLLRGTCGCPAWWAGGRLGRAVVAGVWGGGLFPMRRYPGFLVRRPA